MLPMAKFSLSIFVMLIVIPKTISLDLGCAYTFVSDIDVVCGISETGGTLFQSPAAFCASDFETLDYLEIAKTTFCEDVIYEDGESAITSSLTECYSLISTGQNTNDFYTYDQNSVCTMTKGEACYRNFAERQYFDAHFTLADTHVAVGDELACCRHECISKFPFYDGACGSDENQYSDIDDICDAYCGNRTLQFAAACSIYGDVDCTDYPGCGTTCAIPTEGEAVCGDDGNLYTTSADYCAALGNETVTGYKACDGACTAEDCEIKVCLFYLEKVNYQTTTICGDSGTFYNNHEDYCVAKVNETEKYFLLCDGEACTQNSDCCLKHCTVTYNSDTTFCASDFTTYANRDDYCADHCDGSPVTLNSTCGANCSSEECCELECLNNTYLDTCIDNDDSLYTQSSYCYDSCFSSVESTTACNLFDSPIPCTQNYCSYLACQADYEATITSYSHICGQANGPYDTAEEFCNARYLTGDETGVLSCNCSVCTSVEACEKAKCVNDFSNSFVNQCGLHSSSYVYYTNISDFCDDFIGDGVTNVKCAGVECTNQECCIKNCPNAEDEAYCDANFNLKTATDDCTRDCNSDSSTIYTCIGGCDQDDCDAFSCLNDFSNYNKHLCVYNDEGDFLSVMDKTAYCNAHAGDGSFVPHKCTTVDCSGSTSEALCNFDKCVNDTTNFTKKCLDNYTVLDDVYSYCEAKVSSAPFAMCGSAGSEYECSERECCNQKCVNENHPDYCSVDFYWVYTAEEFCSYRCDGYVINRTDIVVDVCEDEGAPVDCTNCLLFKCRDQAEVAGTPIVLH